MAISSRLHPLVVDACRAARLTGDRNLHRSKVLRTRALLRRNKEQFIRSLEEEVEGHFLVNDLRPAYQALRNTNSKPSSEVIAVHSVGGQISCCVNLDEGSAGIPLPNPPISEDAPSLTEVRGAISKLKSEGEGGPIGLQQPPRHHTAPYTRKVLAHILLRRIRDHLLRHQRPEQSEFPPMVALNALSNEVKPLGLEVS
ncbi:uncharacterized protein [Penaeus vannamei]|uniref:uncharacterized protein n=1 Tax=Penaeus vannamei TaxID=6689 RepID=UPI00387F9318